MSMTSNYLANSQMGTRQTGVLTGLLGYIHSQTKNRDVKKALAMHLMAEVESEEREAMRKQNPDYQRLTSLISQYKSNRRGWDGDAGRPLSRKAISNFMAVLNAVDLHLISGLMIYPESNGAMLIESTKSDAGISLGKESFSYYIIDNHVVKGEDDVPFSVESMIDTLKLISA